MTFKQRFSGQYKNFECTASKYSLKKIREQSPDVYSAHEIMGSQQQGKRCDDFVLCNCSPSTTGIYIVEVKKGKARHIKEVKEQLQSGANFINGQLHEEDKFDFLPILVSKGMAGSERNQWRGNSVCLRGKTRYIERVKSGGPLKRL